MSIFDAGKLAKDAKESLEKAGKLGGGIGGAAKTVLQGIEKAENAPEQMVEALRKLIAEAKKLLAASGADPALSACVQKAESLLEDGNISSAEVAKLTAELGALLKGGAPGDSKKTADPAPRQEAPISKPKVPEAPKDSAPPKAKGPEFTEVDAGAYYYDAVQWAVQKGVASGTTDTTFSPDKTCTRAQTITFLWRAAGSPAAKGENPFGDVKEGSYYHDAALWAGERGIVTGSSFEPDAAVTRAQLAVFLYRNAGSPAVKGGASFKDVPADADYAQAVAWVAERGITSGTKEGTFNPDAACTRGQIVTFLYRAQK